MGRVKVAILGAGNLGTTLGIVLAGGVPGIRAGKARDVTLWTIEEDVAREIRDARLNTKYLPGVALPRALGITLDLREAIAGATAILFTVPSKVMRDVAKRVAADLDGLPVLIGAAKGLEEGTFRRMSQVIAGECPALAARVLALSGPSIAHELSRGVPTAVVLACADVRLAREVRRDLQTPILRMQVSRDVAGVELGGVLKNAYALGFGLCDGLGLGLNSKAALLARALPELARLGVALGGRRATFYGLAGLGDLVGTSLSDHSRNRRMGEEMARRRPRAEALAAMPGVVEGLGAIHVALDLATRRKIRVPVLEGIDAIIEKGADPLPTMTRLIA